MPQAHNLLNTNTVSIDWISFTVTDPAYDVKHVAEFLGFPVDWFKSVGHGALGYKSLYKLSDYCVKILADGAENMGIHVDISGSAVGFVLETYYKANHMHVNPFDSNLVIDMDDVVASSALRAFLSGVREIGKLSRLDVCLDDKSGWFSPSDIKNYIDNGQVVSKFRKYKYISGGAVSDGSVCGDTLYLGSRQSECMLRIYNKRMEQLDIHPEHKDELPDTWIRWEFELTDDRATRFSDLIVSGSDLSMLYYGLLNNYMRVINIDDSNRSRCSMLTKWSDFIEHVEKLTLYVAPAPRTYFDKTNWIELQVLPTLCGILMIDGYEYIEKHFDHALSRMSPAMWDIIDSETRRRAKRE